MTVSRKTIAVTGATGVMGGAVARHFAKHLDFQVRAVSRDPKSDSAAALRADIPDVEFAQGDLNDEDSLVAAFADAQVVFLRTHYWMLLKEQATKERATTNASSVYDAAMEREAEQWRNVFNALARVALADGGGTLERVIISTLPDPRAVSNGKYSRAYHFESKAKGVQQLHHGAAASLPGYQAVLDKASYLYVGVYLESQFSKAVVSADGRQLIGPTKLDDGTFLFQQVAHPPFVKQPLLWPLKDLGPLAEILGVRAPVGTHLMGGQALTLEQFAHVWGDVLQVKVAWEAIDVEAMVREFCKLDASMEDFARTASQAAAFVTEYGFDGGLGAKWPSDFGVQLADVGDWVRDRDWREWL